MLVANSFDLWKKDTFFSAAEEVQESTDIMESAYRRWVRERRERAPSESFDELSRELQTALGTAKWQLEEFERAVRLSYGHRGEDKSAARHSQFVSVIETQISAVESALRESLREEGKKPFRWVNLNEEERDDFAAFLSGRSSPNNQIAHDETELETPKKPFLETSLRSSASSKREEVSPTKNGAITCHVERATNTRRAWGNSPNNGELRIVIPSEDEPRNHPGSEFDDTPKVKDSRFARWKMRCLVDETTEKLVNWFNALQVSFALTIVAFFFIVLFLLFVTSEFYKLHGGT